MSSRLPRPLPPPPALARVPPPLVRRRDLGRPPHRRRSRLAHAQLNGRPHYVPTGSLPAVAVLPFVNGTGDDGLNYLREAIPDHLIRDLQRSHEHLTVFSFDVVADAVRKLGLEPGAPLTPDDLAAVSARTGAGWLLVGYVTRSGPKLRLDYELREAEAAASAASLRTDHIPGTEAELPVMEDRLADGVRRAFGVPTSSGPDALFACSVQATRFYESARAIERKYVLSLAPADLEKVIGLFDQAREADPGCALAYLGLGDAYQMRFVYEGRDPETLRLMNENYERAYEIAPDRAEINVGVAWAHFFKQDNDQAYALPQEGGRDRPGQPLRPDRCRIVPAKHRRPGAERRVFHPGHQGGRGDGRRVLVPGLVLRADGFLRIGAGRLRQDDRARADRLPFALPPGPRAHLDAAQRRRGGRAGHGRDLRAGERPGRDGPGPARGGERGPEGRPGGPGAGPGQGPRGPGDLLRLARLRGAGHDRTRPSTTSSTRSATPSTRSTTTPISSRTSTTGATISTTS